MMPPIRAECKTTGNNACMARVAWAQSVTPIAPPTSAHPTFRTLAYAGLVTGAWSSLLSLAVYGLARGIGVPMEVVLDGIPEVVPWVLVVVIPLGSAIAGALLAGFLRGFRYAGRIVFWVGTLTAALSCINPLTQPVEWSTRIWLTIPHIITWFLVVPQVARIIGDTEPGLHEERA
jgi:hypothetical protein